MEIQRRAQCSSGASLVRAKHGVQGGGMGDDNHHLPLHVQRRVCSYSRAPPQLQSLPVRGQLQE